MQQSAQKHAAPGAFDAGQDGLAGAVNVAVQLAEVYFTGIGYGRVRVRLLPSDPGCALAGSDHFFRHRVPRNRLVAASYFRFQSTPRRVVAQQSTDYRQRAIEISNVDVHAKFARNFGQRSAVAAYADFAHRQRLADRQAPSLVERGAKRK